MSMNIDGVDVLALDAWMKAADVIEFTDDHESDLAGCSFLDDMWHPARLALRRGEPDALIRIPNFRWTGEGSGSNFGFLIEEICPKIIGRVEVVFGWEGSSGSEGLRVVDGRVTRPRVVKTLVEDGG